MIIVEGVDNTGKTTLINALTTVFPMLTVGKFDKAPEAAVDDYRNYVWGVLGQAEFETRTLLYDRFLFSELVYGPILRNQIRLTDNEVTASLRLLRYHNPLVIYCDRTLEQIKETFGEREQLSGVSENIEFLIAGYNYWMAQWGRRGRLIRYDFGEKDAQLKIIGAVAEHLRGERT